MPELLPESIIKQQQNSVKAEKEGRFRKYRNKEGKLVKVKIKAIPLAELQARWKKKKEHLEKLAGNIRSLRYNLTRDLKSNDEKTRLTALVISLMDCTAERVGNQDSAESGHFGVTGFQKKHVTVIGNKIHLSYRGKSGVDHEKSFSDKLIAQTLKQAIKDSPGKFVFTTSDGFRIHADRVNRYLKEYHVTAKDIRGYCANSYVINKLKKEAPSLPPTATADLPKDKLEKKRKSLFNKSVKWASTKVGHGTATLKNHYLMPEVGIAYIQRGEIINLIDFYSNGGDTSAQGRDAMPRVSGNDKPKHICPCTRPVGFKKKNRVKRFSKGGNLPDNKKSTNFNIKPTKDEIGNVISGTSSGIETGTIQAVANYLRGIAPSGEVAEGEKQQKAQEAERLKKYISDSNLWVSDSYLENYVDEGFEQKVYFDEKFVYKINDSIFYTSWKDYFNSLLLHNYFFPTTSYELVGFTKDDSTLYAVVKQPAIKATEKTDLDVVKKFMSDNGFENTKNNDYYNPELGIILEDLHDENVLTRNGILYFVDTVFYLNTSRKLNSSRTQPETLNFKLGTLYSKLWSHNNNLVAYAQHISKMLLAGHQFKSKIEHEKIAKTYGIQHADIAKEWAEYAVVLTARKIVSAVTLSGVEGARERAKQTFDKLTDLYARQPSLTHRTSTTITKQQYSTPAPIAYLMSYWATQPPSAVILSGVEGSSEGSSSKVLKYAYKKGDKVIFIGAGGKLVKAIIDLPSTVKDDGTQVWLTDKGYIAENEVLPYITSAKQESAGQGYKMFKGIGNGKNYRVEFADGNHYTSYKEDRESAIMDAIRHRLYTVKNYPKTETEATRDKGLQEYREMFQNDNEETFRPIERVKISELEYSHPLPVQRDKSVTKGPIEVWKDADTGNMIIENGHHRVAEATERGEQYIDAIITYTRADKENEGSAYELSANEVHELINSTKLFFEPTAGTGLLTIATPSENWVVNEIDKTRLDILRLQGFASVLNQDATKKISFPKRITNGTQLETINFKLFNSIVANPPFGNMHEIKYGNFKLTGLEQLISARALEYMKDDGKCALIIGGNTEYDERGRIKSKKDLVFFNYLAKHYNLVDVINISPELFRRQGAVYPTRIILISGTQSGGNTYYPLADFKADNTTKFSTKAVDNLPTLYSRILGE